MGYAYLPNTLPNMVRVCNRLQMGGGGTYPGTSGDILSIGWLFVGGVYTSKYSKMLFRSHNNLTRVARILRPVEWSDKQNNLTQVKRQSKQPQQNDRVKFDIWWVVSTTGTEYGSPLRIHTTWYLHSYYLCAKTQCFWHTLDFFFANFEWFKIERLPPFASTIKAWRVPRPKATKRFLPFFSGLLCCGKTHENLTPISYQRRCGLAALHPHILTKSHFFEHPFLFNLVFWVKFQI